MVSAREKEKKGMPMKYYNQMDRIDTEKAITFVEHIKEHLKPSEKVICTICGKTIDDIYEDECEKGEYEG